jgi:hypothetical protein
MLIRRLFPAAVLAAALTLCAPGAIAAADGGASASAKKCKKGFKRVKGKCKKVKKKAAAPSAKATIEGFAIGPVPIGDLTKHPPIPAEIALTANQGTISSCGGLIPRPVPVGGFFAGLIIVSKYTGPANALTYGFITGPTGARQGFRLSTKSGRQLATQQDGSNLVLLDRNGPYSWSAEIKVVSGRQAKTVQKLSGTFTVACPGG